MSTTHETREALATRRALRAATLEGQRAQARRELDAFRESVKTLKRERAALLVRVRAQCATARERARAAAKARRAAALRALRTELKQFRQAERNRCQGRKVSVRLDFGKRIGAKLAAAEQARRDQASVRRVDSHRKKAEAKAQAHEQRRESDDEVRANLDADLVPVFDMMRSKIHARPGMSRTEAFTHWIAENESEVWPIREHIAQRQLGELMRAQRKADQAHARELGAQRQAERAERKAAKPRERAAAKKAKATARAEVRAAELAEKAAGKAAQAAQVAAGKAAKHAAALERKANLRAGMAAAKAGRRIERRRSKQKAAEDAERIATAGMTPAEASDWSYEQSKAKTRARFTPETRARVEAWEAKRTAELEGERKKEAKRREAAAATTAKFEAVARERAAELRELAAQEAAELREEEKHQARVARRYGKPPSRKDAAAEAARARIVHASLRLADAIRAGDEVSAIHWRKVWADSRARVVELLGDQAADGFLRETLINASSREEDARAARQQAAAKTTRIRRALEADELAGRKRIKEDDARNPEGARKRAARLAAFSARMSGGPTQAEDDERRAARVASFEADEARKAAERAQADERRRAAGLPELSPVERLRAELGPADPHEEAGIARAEGYDPRSPELRAKTTQIAADLRAELQRIKAEALAADVPF